MGAILGAVWSFLGSDAGQALIVIPVATWALRQLAKQTTHSKATAIATYFTRAFEAAEGLHLPGAEKYLKALEMAKVSLKNAGLVKPGRDGLVKFSPEVQALFDELARQFGLSRKPTPRVLGKK